MSSNHRELTTRTFVDVHAIQEELDQVRWGLHADGERGEAAEHAAAGGQPAPDVFLPQSAPPRPQEAEAGREPPVPDAFAAMWGSLYHPAKNNG